MSAHAFSLRRLLLGASFVLLLVGSHFLVNYFVLERGAICDLVDIQSPAVLRAKIDALRGYCGYKVVLLGDSVVYGSALRQHGDPQWREHNLASVLARRFREDLPGQDVLVLNLGMDGAVPGDLEVLARLLDGCDVDLLILDVTLRAFAEDFAPPEALLSRPWLAELNEPHQPAARLPLGERLEHILGEAVRSSWAVYRFRDFLQVRLLDGSPRSAVAGLQQRLEHSLQSSERGGLDSEDEELLLAMKARRRYQSVDLRPEHAQRQALERMLAHLSRRGQKTVLFYAKENPDVVNDLLEAPRYSELQGRLREIIAHHSGPTIRFLPPVEELGPSRYLDHAHIDAEGYEILADHLRRVEREL